MTGKGIYHCFGCGVTGDHFRFLTEKAGMSFPEAVEKLAGHGRRADAGARRAARKSAQESAADAVSTSWSWRRSISRRR